MNISANYGQFYRGSQFDYYKMAEELAESGKEIPEIYMLCGTEDNLLETNRKFRDHLQKLNFPLTYVEAPGAHEWGLWDDHIQKFMATLPLEK